MPPLKALAPLVTVADCTPSRKPVGSVQPGTARRPVRRPALHHDCGFLPADSESCLVLFLSACWRAYRLGEGLVSMIRFPLVGHLRSSSTAVRSGPAISPPDARAGTYGTLRAAERVRLRFRS